MASSDVNRLIDMLYERIEEAKAPALKPGMSIVDRDEIFWTSCGLSCRWR